jgi:phosphoribosyl-ATP pyrophosphohydrolase/phosphoribosyl-AMP cyclohydrolase
MNIRYDENGLVPAIVQDADTAMVLMLGYMNAESLQITLATKKVTFYSRSRQELWTKGDTSGNYLHLIQIKPDCDNDTLLITARPEGPTCHNGTFNCWGDEKMHAGRAGFLAQLEDVITSRLAEGNPESYTVKLSQKGVHKVAQKVGEEAVETVIEALRADKKKLAEESADLLYHLILLWNQSGISMHDVVEVLKSRHR